MSDSSIVGRCDRAYSDLLIHDLKLKINELL